MDKSRVEIKKVRVGVWHPKTYFDVFVDGEMVGRYPTQKEAMSAGDSRVRTNDEQWAVLSEQFE